MLPAHSVGLAVSAIIALGVIDRHRENFLGVSPKLQARLASAHTVFSQPPSTKYVDPVE